MAELSDVRYTAIPHLSKCKHRVLQALCLPFSGVFHRKTWLGALACVVFFSEHSTWRWHRTELQSCPYSRCTAFPQTDKTLTAKTRTPGTWERLCTVRVPSPVLVMSTPHCPRQVWGILRQAFHKKPLCRLNAKKAVPDREYSSLITTQMLKSNWNQLQENMLHEQKPSTQIISIEIGSPNLSSPL